MNIKLFTVVFAIASVGLIACGDDTGTGGGGGGGSTGTGGTGVGASGAGGSGAMGGMGGMGDGGQGGEKACSNTEAPYTCAGFITSCAAADPPADDCYDGDNAAVCEASYDLLIALATCVETECADECGGAGGGGGADGCAECQIAVTAGNGACVPQMNACVGDT